MLKTLVAAAAAGALALPTAALASALGDNLVMAQAGGAAGGADTGASTRQPGANPPGASGTAGQAGSSATGGAAGRGGFERLDRNNDGFISRDEANNAPELNTRFTELDKNNDGKLSREEYNALGSGAAGATGATRGGSTK